VLVIDRWVTASAGAPRTDSTPAPPQQQQQQQQLPQQSV